MYYTAFSTPLCNVILLGDESGLTRVHLITDESNRDFELPDDLIKNDAIFSDARQQIIEYMAGERKEFDLRLNPEGTPYQKLIWKKLEKIPYGQVYSYKDIAEKLGNPKASRAVGMANGKNPLPLVVPCHRVIGADGRLTGYAFGLKLKKDLLDMEGCNL